jgi:sugar lactone lactonase YvrE
MTFDQVSATGRVAICHLPGGVQLRYDPTDGTVRSLPYPGMPHQWREASAYHEALPTEGWEHYRGCGCPVCTGDAEVAEERERASA